MADIGNFVAQKTIGNYLDTKNEAKKIQAKKLAEALTAARQIGYMQEMAKELPSGEGVVDPYITGAMQWIKKIAKQAPQQTSYDDLREGLVAGSVGTGVGGEQRLTDVDILRYLKLLPDKWNSKSEEETKFGDILGNLGAMAGDEQPKVESAWGEGQKAYYLKKILQRKMLEGNLGK